MVHASRAPPASTIRVHITLDVRSAIVYKLIVIIPPGFVFPDTGCGSMCVAGPPLGSTSRRTATLESPTGERLMNFKDMEILVHTPEETPGGAQSWYVEALGMFGTPTVGWGEGVGFKVQQMKSGVAYAGVANLRRAQICFHFTLMVDAGSEITVEP